MFGQSTQDQQQTQNDQNDFSQTAPTNDSWSSAPAPAPGAPIGPIITDDSSDDVVQAAIPVSVTAPVQDSDTVIPTTSGSVPTDELLDIKQDALQELSPLVDHLEQTPEEKFRTTMMMIQASDDHSLVKAAYEAAKQITDEKARAQALLDVVNEINYFTQQQQS